MSLPADRKGLNKKDGLKIKALIEESLGSGFTAETREGASFIGIFRNGIHIGSLHWIVNVGWQPSIVQPYVFCKDDMTHLIDEIHHCIKGMDETQNHWETWQADRSETNWQNYQGSRAAYSFRMYPVQEDASATALSDEYSESVEDADASVQVVGIPDTPPEEDDLRSLLDSLGDDI